MQTLITQGVEVGVQTRFQPEHSDSIRGVYVFAYRIALQNHNTFTVQLLRRKWRITDANLEVKIVEGDGVVGRQPVLYPGDSYDYVSACHLETPIGKMEGSYVFQNKQTGAEFEVHIPLFKLAAPEVLN